MRPSVCTGGVGRFVHLTSVSLSFVSGRPHAGELASRATRICCSPSLLINGGLESSPRPLSSLPEKSQSVTVGQLNATLVGVFLAGGGEEQFPSSHMTIFFHSYCSSLSETLITIHPIPPSSLTSRKELLSLFSFFHCIAATIRDGLCVCAIRDERLLEKASRMKTKKESS